MSGIRRFLWLPFVAMSLLLLGCGVPIASDAITATAVADQPTPSTQTLNSTFSGSAFEDTAQSLRAGSAVIAGAPVPTVEPIATLGSATQTPEGQLQTLEATATPEATTTSAPDVTATPIDAGRFPEVPPDGSTPNATEAPAATPTEVPSPAATPTPEPTATPAPVVSNVNGDFPAQFLQLLNAQRTGRGLQPLNYSPVIAAGANQYAQYMGTADFFGHDAPDGSTPASRAEATGYAGSWNGEALSAGQITPQDALNALLASPPHAKILLDPNSVDVGIGYAYVQNSHYRSYWVVMTGIP